MKPIFRVVSGHDEDGKSVVSMQGEPPTVIDIAAIPGTRFHEIWATKARPLVDINGEDPTLQPLKLSPPKGGTRCRVVDIPPDTPEFLAGGVAQVADGFSELGERSAATSHNHSPHPLMHRTESVDYGVVLEGTITLVLDKEEVELPAGSVVVQRGTNHAWANRTQTNCRMLFVLVSGEFATTTQQ